LHAKADWENLAFEQRAAIYSKRATGAGAGQPKAGYSTSSQVRIGIC
jgi:hypothetical protein